MRTPLPLLLLALLALPGCGGGGSPIQADLGGGEETRIQVGPAGGLIRGEGPLAGFELDIPEGALGQLSIMSLSTGPEIELLESRAVTPAAQISLEPDPGPLRKPATLRWRLDWPAIRPVGDLLVAGTVPIAGASAPGDRRTPGLAAALGSYDRDLRTFSCQIGQLSSMQVRAALQQRSLEDSAQLLGLALAELGRGTDAGLAAAEQRLNEALRADPFYPEGRFLRALTRLAVRLNARDDTGAGIDSLGEVLQAYGLDVASRSLLQRALSDDWPARLRPIPDPPEPELVVRFLQVEFGTAALGALVDLNYVPAGLSFELDLPAGLVGLAGLREIDTADHLLLRGACAALLGGLSQVRSLNLAVSPRPFTGAEPRPQDPGTWLAAEPGFGRPDQDLSVQAKAEWARALGDLRAGLRALMAEEDAQDDDLLVFTPGFTRAEQERFLANLDALFVSLREGLAQSLSLGARGSLAVDLSRLLGADFDPRAGFPAFAGFLPLAGSLGDATLGGVFPSLTQDRAADLYHLANRHRLEVVAGLSIDGRPGDWPAAAAALQPKDPNGDADALSGLDLRDIYLGLSGDELVFRLDLYRGEFGDVGGQTNVYGLEIRPVDDPGLPPGQPHRIEVQVQQQSYQLTARRLGVEVPVRARLATEGTVLEVAVNRFDLLPPDEPRRDWILKAFASGLDAAGSTEELDQTRRVLVTF